MEGWPLLRVLPHAAEPRQGGVEHVVVMIVPGEEPRPSVVGNPSAMHSLTRTARLAPKARGLQQLTL
eukprot:scaffold463_cov242-Pinguiococcus_pyrenoidosus.AAC.13